MKQRRLLVLHRHPKENIVSDDWFIVKTSDGLYLLRAIHSHDSRESNEDLSFILHEATCPKTVNTYTHEWSTESSTLTFIVGKDDWSRT